MKLVAMTFLLCAVTFGSENNKTKNYIEKQVKKEQKYSVEQKFYGADEYDFKGAEVDEKSLEDIPDMPTYNDDFDMDNVYD